MLNARILFGGTATLASISFIAAQSHSAAELLSSAFGFLYGILILVSLKEKPTLGKKSENKLLPNFYFADPPGFEPETAGPKPAVLPLHHGSLIKECKIIIFFLIYSNFYKFILKMFIFIEQKTSEIK